MAGEDGRGRQPGSLEALNRFRAVGWGHVPPCARENCRQPSTAGSRFCKMHGGIQRARNYGKPTAARAAIREAKNRIARAYRAGAIPATLHSLPIWRACERNAAVVWRPRLLDAFTSRDTDPEAWGRVLAGAEAHIASLPPGWWERDKPK